MIWNEIKIMRSLGLSNDLLSLYEVHETKGSVYLILEYYDGTIFHNILLE